MTQALFQQAQLVNDIDAAITHRHTAGVAMQGLFA